MREPSSVSHAEFSARLTTALLTAGYPTTPSKLAREFNRRHVNHMISPQTAGGWLSGRTIPSRMRLNALAKWMGLAPAFLLFGDASKADHMLSLSEACTESDEIALVTNFKQLDDYGRKVAMEVIRSLARLKGDVSPTFTVSSSDQVLS